MKLNYLSFGDSSKHLLAVTKAKAKMVEFSISEQQHLAISIAPQKLLTLTIGILGELSSLISRGIEDQNRMYHLKNELKKTAQYFDALNQTELESELKDYLNLLGASAYYLLDMPGNSNVLIRKILSHYEKYTSFNCDLKLTSNPIIETGLVWLLKHNHLNDGKLYPTGYSNFNRILSFIFEKFYNCHSFRMEQKDIDWFLTEVHRYGDDSELLFSYILVAILQTKLKNLSTNNLPKYTELTLADWQPALQKRSFIKEFWPAQKVLGEKGIFKGRSAVIQLPTGAGKTKSTEIIIRSAFLSGRTNVAVIIAPFRALVNEISADFRKAFLNEKDIKINQLSDIPSISLEEDNMLIELYSLLGVELEDGDTSQTIIITTPEKLLYLLRQRPELKDLIGLVILDEAHQFDSGSRGITYELLLTELKMAITNINAQFVLISAVISNAEQIGKWLYGENGIAIHSLENLSTEKSIAYTNWQTDLGQLHYVDSDLDERDYFVPRIIKKELLGDKKTYFPIKKPNSLASYLGLLLCQQRPTAIFCGVARSVRSICEIIVDAYSKEYSYLPSPVTKIPNKVELDKIYNLAKLHFGVDNSFSKAIKLGVLPHGANIPNGLRVVSEWAIANNQANLIVCTSTLSQGVNLPLKYLVVSNIYQGKEQISTRDFQNLVGRVGRSGYFTEGDIIFADTQIFETKLNYKEKWRWERVNSLLRESNSEACISSLKQLIDPIPYLDASEQEEWLLWLAKDECEFEKNCANDLDKLIKNYQDFGFDSQKKANEARILIEKNIYFKKKIIQALENFMIAYLNDNENTQIFDLVTLAENTLAYYLIENEEEKNLFKRVFEVLAERTNNLEDSKKIFFSKTLLGFNDLKKIESYLLDEADLLQSDEICLLKEIWEFIVSLTQYEFIHKMSLDSTINIAVLWVEGKSLFSIDEFIQKNDYKYQWGQNKQGTIYIEQLMQLTSNNFGHNLSMIIGAMADICDGIEDLRIHSKMFRNLQSMMRVGLPDKLSLFLYEKGFVDREICKVISQGLQNHGIDKDNFDSSVLRDNKKIIIEALEDYPSYFKEIQIL